MRKIRLEALIFSFDDYLAVRDWCRDNCGIFEVTMPSGIACAPLTSVIFHPDILNSAGDGILIADHRRYSDIQISMVVRQLRLRKKLVYSVANGICPVLGADETEIIMERAAFADTPILKILHDCRPALRWLDERGPTQSLPGKFADSVKRLEKLGLVFRRNQKTFSLRRQRLRKVLEHESKKLTVAWRIEDLLHR